MPSRHDGGGVLWGEPQLWGLRRVRLAAAAVAPGHGLGAADKCNRCPTAARDTGCLQPTARGRVVLPAVLCVDRPMDFGQLLLRVPGRWRLRVRASVRSGAHEWRVQRLDCRRPVPGPVDVLLCDARAHRDQGVLSLAFAGGQLRGRGRLLRHRRRGAHRQRGGQCARERGVRRERVLARPPGPGGQRRVEVAERRLHGLRLHLPRVHQLEPRVPATGTRRLRRPARDVRGNERGRRAHLQRHVVRRPRRRLCARALPPQQLGRDGRRRTPCLHERGPLGRADTVPGDEHHDARVHRRHIGLLLGRCTRHVAPRRVRDPHGHQLPPRRRGLPLAARDHEWDAHGALAQLWRRQLPDEWAQLGLARRRGRAGAHQRQLPDRCQRALPHNFRRTVPGIHMHGGVRASPALLRQPRHDSQA